MPSKKKVLGRDGSAAFMIHMPRGQTPLMSMHASGAAHGCTLLAQMLLVTPLAVPKDRPSCHKGRCPVRNASAEHNGCCCMPPGAEQHVANKKHGGRHVATQKNIGGGMTHRKQVLGNACRTENPILGKACRGVRNPREKAWWRARRRKTHLWEGMSQKSQACAGFRDTGGGVRRVSKY